MSEFEDLISRNFTVEDVEALEADALDDVCFVKSVQVIERICDQLLSLVPNHESVVEALRHVAEDIEDTLGGSDEA